MFNVADGEISLDELIIGQPAINNLREDTRTRLEQNRSTLDGTECARVQGPL